MRELKVSERVYRQYQRETRDNENISKDQCELKLLRNMKLGVLKAREKGRGTYVMYGNLHFIVSDNDIVVWIKNHCPAPEGWKRDNRRYIELGEELGIEEKTTMLELYKKDITIRAKKKIGKMKWVMKDMCKSKKEIG